MPLTVYCKSSLAAHEYVKFFDEQQFEGYEEQIMDPAIASQTADSTMNTSTPMSDPTGLGHKNSVDSGHGSIGTGGRLSCSGSSDFSSCAASPASVDEKTVQRSASECSVLKWIEL